MANTLTLGTVWGFIAGLVASWALNGAQGENTWWLIAVTCIAFYIITRKNKKEGMTLDEVIKDIVAQNQRRSIHLDPTAVDVERFGESHYKFDFYNDGETFDWYLPIAGGLQGISARSIPSLRREILSKELELKKTEPKEDENE